MNLKMKLNGESLTMSSSNKSESTKTIRESLKMRYSASSSRFRPSVNSSKKFSSKANTSTKKKHSVESVPTTNVNNLLETHI